MLEKLLHSKAAANVLATVMEHDGLHLRDIARRAGVSPSEARRELGNLAAVGILRKERKGPLLFFKLNRECPFLPELKGLYRKTDGIFAGLRKLLGSEKGIKYAFVFGSMARGGERERSDVDLMVIGDFDQKYLGGKLFEVQGRAPREVNYIFWTTHELQEKADKQVGFLLDIARNKRTWLVGDEHEFIGIVEERHGKKSGS